MIISSEQNKSVGTYQLLVPRIEALALPDVIERATSKPTLICIHFSLYRYGTYRQDAISHTSKGMRNISHPEGIYRCLVL